MFTLSIIAHVGTDAFARPGRDVFFAAASAPVVDCFVMGTFFRSPLGIRDLSYVEPVTLFAENYRKADSALREKSACSTEKL
jgi:hypothetical protein